MARGEFLTSEEREQILIGIVYAAAGAPRRLSEWLWAAILAGALILPDVAGFGIGGMRLDLKPGHERPGQWPCRAMAGAR